MNESEDSSILADIQALDKALVLDIKAESQQEQDDCDNQSSFSADASPAAVDDEDNYLDANRDIDADQDSLDAYEINRRLIVGLTIAKEKLTALLQECDHKIKKLDVKIKVHTNGSSSRRCPISSIGIPYFKDKNNFSAPKNYDTKLKESRGELFLLSLKSPGRWSEKDRDTLLRAVHNQAIESVLLTNCNIDDDEEGNEELSERSRKPDKRKRNGQEMRTKFVLPKSLNELVGALGEKEFDWCKISVTDFDSKHSPEECRAMWNVYLHPQIRKSNWTGVEDKRLLRYAKQHRFQDWDTIAVRLQTNRSAYQCFIRYNTIKSVPSAGRTWSKAEDKHLVKVVNTLKIGDYIPWSQIASYLCHRTKQQIYTRWTYRKAPHLRKGRFTQAETETLLKAMNTYGRDFSKISNAIMPSRTPVQLSEHYYTLKKNQNGANVWTIDDDMKLIQLHKKYGNDWSRIQNTHFVHKTRTQVRHRFNALVRYIKKGISIECIPRQYPSSYNIKKNTPINNKLLLKYHDKNTLTLEKIPATITTTDIQLKLYETLSFPPSTKTTNSQDELYNLGQLACETKKLYNVLKLLDLNLDIPYNFLKYIHVSRKDKQLLISLKEYINERTNRIQNGEIVENLKLRMFGKSQSVGENSRFIPPVPFCGHTRKRKANNKMQQCIDCVINLNQNFIIDALTEFPKTPAIEPFISIEEKDQFDKFSQLLTNNCYDYEREIINLDELEYSSFFNKRDIKYCTQIEQSSNLQKATEHVKEDNRKMCTSNNGILPNRATLLGFKNLLLWKLLYEYQIKSGESSSFMEDSQKSEETVIIDSEESNEYKRAYKLLRTRLYQLFKFPIGLSNTMLEMCDPDTTVLETVDKTAKQTTKEVSRKRKYEDVNPVFLAESNKEAKVNILADSNCQQNTNTKTIDLPMVRSSKRISKKYKIIAK
ncbi:hypothetical protein DMN91_002561 [Ooceraea biroi]|uniref:snRNA-activating protein complex subunit n=1 Tax=Ooceraea biroi TaxID=2015173 RepID=A0A3L8DVY3_OOCBI|nr:uncharacterized protein LOC105278109 [Ooceraea biroi]XP_011335239.2 uncharacterized protein LOC105278109 [Ooceraea biroi]RLU24472.1 hypothetical protein DMN91_002561 [Ooceraea biroi]